MYFIKLISYFYVYASRVSLNEIGNSIDFISEILRYVGPDIIILFLND